MQSGFRGYLLTSDTVFLDNYYNGVRTVPGLLDEQKQIIKENKAQSLLLDSIQASNTQWIAYANSLIEAKKQLSAESQNLYNKLFETKLKNKVGKNMNDQITAQFSAFDRIEYKSRNTHADELISSIKRTHTFSYIFITLTILIGATSAIYIIILISKRIKSMVRLAENISRGEFTIVKDSRNDELTGLSRSLNIMSEKLRENILELEKRNTELDKFAYVVSHDLKAPVRGIHNVVKWIEEDLDHQLTPELKNHLGIIQKRTKRMEDLINGLLNYARINEKTRTSDVDVNKMVRDITDTIVPRNFKVEVQNLPLLHTESIKLEQVFTNLISNSVKYTPHQNGQISINCTEFPSYYQFSVKDNGIGIDPEYHQKIFEIFQTLREKHELESTGIGLSIVKKIIDEQQGTITLNSTTGKGAEFIFTWKKQKQTAA